VFAAPVGAMPDGLPELLAAVGDVVDVTDEAAGAAVLAARRPAGIVAFSDRDLPLAARLASRLGLRYHSESTVLAATDKDVQRRRFREAGLQVPRSRVLDRPDQVVEDLARMLASGKNVVNTSFVPLLLPRAAGVGVHEVGTRTDSDADRLQLMAAVRGQGAYRQGAGLDDPVPTLDGFHTVADLHEHWIACTESEGAEAARDGVGPGIELRKGQPPEGIDHGLRAGV